MKLVLCYTVGDGCSWSADETVPFEYESKEKAEYDLLCLWEKCEEEWRNYKKLSDIIFAGRKYELVDFSYWNDDLKKRVYIEPDIFELDEWFEQFKSVDNVIQ